MEHRSALRHFFVACTRLLYGTVMVLLITARFSLSLPVVSEIRIIGGERGVAISFSADAPFAAEFSGIEKSVVARLKGCVYGLPEFSYGNFSAASPLRSISAAEKKNSTVEVTIVLKRNVKLPVKALQKNTQWIALLSDEPVQPFTWNTAQNAPRSSPVTPAVAQPEKGPERQGRLENIRFLQRGQIGELALEFDTEVSCSLHRSGTTVTVTVENVRNGVGSKRLSLPENGAFKRVSLREYGREGGTGTVLDVSVLIDTAHIESNFSVAFTHGAIVSLFVMHRDNRKATLWTSGHGLSWNYQFYDVPSYNMDMQSLGKRARHDAGVKLAREKTFAIKEPPVEPPADAVPTAEVEVPSPAAQTPPEPATDAAAVRAPMIVTANRLNLRSSPSRTAAVAGKLSRGNAVTAVEKSGDWYKVEVRGLTGYVAAAFLRDRNAGDDSISRDSALDRPKDTQVTQAIEPPSSITMVSRVAVSPSVSPAVPAVMTGEIPARNDNQNIDPPGAQKRMIRYQAGGRDPFKPIVSSSVSLRGLPFVENLTLVGVLFDDEDHIVLCEDKQNGNRPFSFREHDPVEKGKVLKIYKDKVVFLITEYGVSRSFTLELSQASPGQEAGVK
ncbi:MAG: SH3 domain-containing protein [Chitinispirillaceae bacterium]|nr:SH3 domain-containing protein [Chitinispirillaceae bacterium]